MLGKLFGVFLKPRPIRQGSRGAGEIDLPDHQLYRPRRGMKLWYGSIFGLGLFWMCTGGLVWKNWHDFGPAQTEGLVRGIPIRMEVKCEPRESGWRALWVNDTNRLPLDLELEVFDINNACRRLHILEVRVEAGGDKERRGAKAGVEVAIDPVSRPFELYERLLHIKNRLYTAREQHCLITFEQAIHHAGALRIHVRGELENLEDGREPFERSFQFPHRRHIGLSIQWPRLWQP